MAGVCTFAKELMSSFHCARRGCGIGKWNFMG